MNRLLIVMFGGGVGSGARYLLSGWVAERLGAGWPYGTLAVNLLGSLALGFIAELGARSAAMSLEVRLLLTTGFMGGFTTYSTFNYETLKLLQDGRMGAAALNVGLTLLGALAGAVLGVWAARALVAG